MTRKVHDLDRERTETARFQDKRSYWTNSGHEFLFGDDVRNRRQEIYDRDKGLCQGCGGRVNWIDGHMHHIKGGLVGRCSCMHNLAWLCGACHQKEHVQLRWSNVGNDR